MKNTISGKTPARDLISPTWIVDALVTVRDRLLSLDNDALVSARDVLAVTVSEAIGGLSVAPARPEFKPLLTTLRTLDDGLPGDFEDAAQDWTPTEVLALSLPPIAGGAPEPFIPSEADWQDFADATDDRDWYREIDAQAAGLAV